MIFFTGVVVALVCARFASQRSGRPRHFFAAAGVAAVVIALVFAPTGLLLEKSIGRLVMPLGLAWLSMLILAFGCFFRGHPRFAGLFAIPWLLLTFAGNEPLANVLTGAVEGEPADPFSEAPFDAVIVLGGGTSETHLGAAQLGSSGDRVVLGARLYHRGLTPVLVTSGSPIAGFSEHDAAAATVRIWTELGVPPSAIVRVDGARTTTDEARLHAALIRERGWARVGVVSSAIHLRRAMSLFEHEGARVVPLAAGETQEPVRWRGLPSLIPYGDAARRVHAACWELVGRWVGR